MADSPGSGAAGSADVDTTAAAAAKSEEGSKNPYGGHSDEELTALAAHWDSLDRHQRRALLTEMKLRMARNGKRKGVIHIRTERRYGRIIRQSDGRVIHIETQVVRVRPLDPDALEAHQSFGVGFEQRIGRRQSQQQDSRDASADSRTVQRAGIPPPVPGDGAGQGVGSPSLNGVLESLAPSTQAPQMNRLPVYQVSDPKP